MPSENRRTIAKELVDHSLSYIKEQRENLAAIQQQMRVQESERKPPKEFEPSTDFYRVFSETVGKRTRPSVNINLKENPRLTHTAKSTQQSKENEIEDIRNRPFLRKR